MYTFSVDRDLLLSSSHFKKASALWERLLLQIRVRAHFTEKRECLYWLRQPPLWLQLTIPTTLGGGGSSVRLSFKMYVRRLYVNWMACSLVEEHGSQSSKYWGILTVIRGDRVPCMHLKNSISISMELRDSLKGKFMLWTGINAFSGQFSPPSS